MPRAKKRVVRKSSKSVQARKVVKRSVAPQKNSKNLILFRNILLAILLTVLIAILFLRFSGVTGNVITGNAVSNAEEISQIGTWGDDPDWQSPIWDEVGFIFAILFGQTGYDVAISKIIFALLSFMFVFYIVGKINESMDLKLGSIVKVFVSILLGILFTRWVGQDGLIKAVLMPYNAIGATLATLIPIAIIFYMFFFMKPFNTPKYGPLRTIGLSLLAGFFIMNWFWITSGNWGSAEKPQYSYVYLIATGFTVVLLVTQKNILKSFKVSLALESIEAQNKVLAEEYTLKIMNLEKIMASFSPGDPQYIAAQTKRDKLQQQIIKLARP